MNKKPILIICGIILLLLFIISIWAPWMSRDFAENRINKYYENTNKRVTDGCSVSCDDCGIISYEKRFFGADIVVDVRCGAQHPDRPPSRVYPTVNNLGFVNFRNIEG